MEEKEKGSLKGGMRMGVTLEREAVFSLPHTHTEREREAASKTLGLPFLQYKLI